MTRSRQIDRVREATDIVAIVGEYVRLRKAGNQWQGLCPFHHEKTPSFWVHPEKQVYHCWGCSASGNVFHFLQHVDGLSFKDALIRLAERAGITLEADAPVRRVDRAEAQTLAVEAWVFKASMEETALSLAHEFLLQFLKAEDWLERNATRPDASLVEASMQAYRMAAEKFFRFPSLTPSDWIAAYSQQPTAIKEKVRRRLLDDRISVSLCAVLLAAGLNADPVSAARKTEGLMQEWALKYGAIPGWMAAVVSGRAA